MWQWNHSSSSSSFRLMMLNYSCPAHCISAAGYLYLNCALILNSLYFQWGIVTALLGVSYTDYCKMPVHIQPLHGSEAGVSGYWCIGFLMTPVTTQHFDSLPWVGGGRKGDVSLSSCFLPWQRCWGTSCVLAVWKTQKVMMLEVSCTQVQSVPFQKVVGGF